MREKQRECRAAPMTVLHTLHSVSILPVAILEWVMFGGVELQAYDVDGVALAVSGSRPG